MNSAVISLPQIVRLDQSYEDRAIKLIQNDVLEWDIARSTHGFRAIGLWRRLWAAAAVGYVPQQLKRAVVNIIAAGRHPGLHLAVDLMSELTGDGELSNGDKHDLAQALDRFRVETAYSSWDTNDPRTKSLTLVRAACVRLAKELQRREAVHEAIVWWVDGTRDDPVPEVRYALEWAED